MERESYQGPRGPRFLHSKCARESASEARGVGKAPGFCDQACPLSPKKWADLRFTRVKARENAAELYETEGKLIPGFLGPLLEYF